MNQANIQQVLDQSAQQVATLEQRHWAGWVIYLLEVLGPGSEDAGYRAVLEGVQETLAVRLREGRW